MRVLYSMAAGLGIFLVVEGFWSVQDKHPTAAAIMATFLVLVGLIYTTKGIKRGARSKGN